MAKSKVCFGRSYNLQIADGLWFAFDIGEI